MKGRRVLLSALLLALLVLLGPAAPLGGKDKEYIDGVMLGEQYALKFRTIGGAWDDPNYDEFRFVVQVGQTVYVGAYRKDWRFQYTPKKEDWPEGTSVKLRFEKSSFLGLKTTFMFLRRPNSNKEVRTHLQSVIGPDGKEKCGRFLCG